MSYDPKMPVAQPVGGQAPLAMMAEPIVQHQMVDVTVPAGQTAGSKFPVQLAGGSQVLVTVPQGAAPGMTIRVPVPVEQKPAASMAPQIMHQQQPAYTTAGGVHMVGVPMTMNWGLMPCPIQASMVLGPLGVVLGFAAAFLEGTAAKITGSLALLVYIIVIPMCICGTNELRSQLMRNGQVVLGNPGARAAAIVMYVFGIIDGAALVVYGAVFDNYVPMGWVLGVVFWFIANQCVCLIDVAKTAGQYGQTFSTTVIVHNRV